MGALDERMKVMAARLRADLGVDAGLDAVLTKIQSVDTAEAAIAQSRRMLRDRAASLDAAAEQLRRLARRLSHEQSMLAFTEAGWPSKRDELDHLLAAEPADGVAAWLAHWYAAAARVRIASMERLLADVPLPEGLSVLSRHAAEATSALAARAPERAEMFLLAGASGLRLGARSITEDPVRTKLLKVLVRLHLDRGNVQRAKTLLEHHETNKPNAGLCALRSTVLRLTGETESAERMLGDARDLDDDDVDVTVEMILRAREAGRLDDALDAAYYGAQSLTSYVDIGADRGALQSLPPELLVALADRALTDQDLDLARYLLERAANATAESNIELLALVYERQTRLDTPAATKQDAMIRAGLKLVDLGEPVRAQHYFDLARRVPTDGDPAVERRRKEAGARWADCVLVNSHRRPLRSAREEYLQCLWDAHAAGQVLDLAGAESWVLLVESDVLCRLAGAVDEDKADLIWKALLAAARAVAFNPGSGRHWAWLADAAQNAHLFHIAHTAATHALSLAPQDEWAVFTHARALTNLGRLSGAVAELEGRTDAWTVAVRALALVVEGRAHEAVHLMKDAVDTRSDLWMWQLHINALILAGRLKDAATQSQALLAQYADRDDETDFLLANAIAATTLGHGEAALRWAKRLCDVMGGFDEGTAAGISAEATLLFGDREQGLRQLVDSIAGNRSPLSMVLWQHAERPRLQALARDHGISLPELDHLTALAGDRLAELERYADPETELAEALHPGVDKATVMATTALVTLLGHLAADNQKAAALALPRLRAELPSEAESIEKHLSDSAHERRLKAIARGAISDIRNGRAAAATDKLRRLLAADTYDAAQVLSDLDAPRALLKVLAQLVLDEVHGSRSCDVLTMLGADDLIPAERSTVIRAVVPPSWLTDDIPHPPNVRIVTDEALSPANFAIRAYGSVHSGTLDPELRYCETEALPWLPEQPHEAVTAHPTLNLTGVPLAAEGMVPLITMSPLEVVVRLAATLERKLVVGEAEQQGPGAP